MKSSAVEAVREPRDASGLLSSHSVGLGWGLRRAEASDLEELMRLEAICFEEWRRDPRRQLRESLRNPRHEVWVCPDERERGNKLCAALILRRLPRILRVYSLATDPRWQGKGVGRFLMAFARHRAEESGVRAMRLEADAGRESLLAWYERLGFTRETLMKDFYAPGRDAWRMIAKLADAPTALPE